MTKLLFTLTFILLLSSCYNINKREVVKPEILLSKSQLVEILTEVQITEAGFIINNNRYKANELKPKYYDRILHQYGITLQQLKDNIDYYHDYPEDMEEIYELVLANLSIIQSEVLAEKEEIEKEIVIDSVSGLIDSLSQERDDSIIKKLAK
ncbi:MAG: DUF4296 domain-containing protein [Bacteroidetes bacterium]|nr:DUF4296 domain-containing protein [Bacteroidota bacterium]MBL6944781.1 DUF4296 domain-containing protein [Bacteroidales bacterium]